MTGREQVRRDAIAWLERSRDSKSPSIAQIHAATILAELEQADRRWDDEHEVRLENLARAKQAERERDEWMAPFNGSGIEWHEGLPSPYTYQASDFSKLVAAVHEYESRVLAAEQREAELVEALREIADSDMDSLVVDQPALARAALAAHEQASHE